MKKVLLSCALALAGLVGYAQDTWVDGVVFGPGNTTLDQQYNAYTRESVGTIPAGWMLDYFNMNDNNWSYVAGGIKAKTTQNVSGTASIYSISPIANADYLVIKLGPVLTDDLGSVTLYMASDESFTENYFEADITKLYTSVGAGNDAKIDFSDLEYYDIEGEETTFEALQKVTSRYYKIDFATKAQKPAINLPCASIASLNFYQAATVLKNSGLAFENEEVKVKMADSPYTQTAKIAEGNEGKITYSITYSSSENIATINTETGAVTLNGIGTIEVTAESEAYGDFKAGTASYMLQIEKESATISFEATKFEVKKGETFTAPTITTVPEGLTLRYSSSDTNVATVDQSTGVVTVKNYGVTAITATFPGNTQYDPASASYTLTVTGDNVYVINFMNEAPTNVYSQADKTFSNSNVTATYKYTSGNGYTFNANGINISAGTNTDKEAGKFAIVPAAGYYVTSAIASTVSNASVKWADGIVNTPQTGNYLTYSVGKNDEPKELDLYFLSAANIKYLVIEYAKVETVSIEVSGSVTMSIVDKETGEAVEPSGDLYGKMAFGTTGSMTVTKAEGAETLALKIGDAAQISINAGQEINLDNVLMPDTKVILVATTPKEKTIETDVTTKIKWAKGENVLEGFDAANYKLTQLNTSIVNEPIDGAFPVELRFECLSADLNDLFVLPYVVEGEMSKEGYFFLNAQADPKTEIRYVMSWPADGLTRADFLKANNNVSGSAQVAFYFLTGSTPAPASAPRRAAARAAATTYAAAAATPVNTTFTTLNTGMSGVESVSVEEADAPVEYYNLQGVRLNAEPEHGLYIRRQGKTVTKVVK